ncbi:MAG: CehA/McbA family metallohydrolase [Acidimicrobiales bacterium]
MTPRCVLDGDPTVIEHAVGPAAQSTYRLVDVEVPPGTRRIEVAYTWTPADDAVVDLGLRAPGGAFRGWSGSREGRIHAGQDPVAVEEGGASRGYLAGPIEPGTWSVELGFGDVGTGVAWRLEVACASTPRIEGCAVDDPVDPHHIARDEPGWYRADLHMHGWHSHPDAPGWDDAIAAARAAGVDICAFTEYTTSAHWPQLGAVQRANPDLLIWPAREIITYFGHAVAYGATPSTSEYRVGHRAVRGAAKAISMADIQAAVVADGALFGVAHPTAYPVEEWGHFCRGCEYRLWDQTDLAAVTTMEVVTVGSLVGGHPNPFVRTAIEQWEAMLRAGHRVWAVAGSDDKLGDGYGGATTVIGADRLDVHAVREALTAGRAYIEARGVGASPGLSLTARPISGCDAVDHAAPGQGHADAFTFGGAIAADAAEVVAEVSGAAGQRLSLRANGHEVESVPITDDHWRYRFVGDRRPDEGPLGTFWTIEIHDDRALSALGNPIFVTGSTISARPGR